jgi:hypothetical protein
MRAAISGQSWRVAPEIWKTIVVIVLAVILGVGIASSPTLLLAGLAVFLLAVILVCLFGRITFPLALIIIIPLIPVYGDPPPAGASTVRLGLIAVLLAGGLCTHIQLRDTKSASTIRPLIATLMIVAALGAMVAAAHASGSQQLLKAASTLAGQPIAFAGFLGLFVLTIQNDGDSRKRLLCAWAIATVCEGLFVASQFASGGAYDALRGFSRGQGSTGADFLGAFSAISFFGAVALRSIATSARTKILAWAAMTAAIGSLMASTSRGSLVGVGLGLTYLAIRRRPAALGQARRHVGLILLLLILVSGGLYATKSLWISRLNVHGGATGFDRPATWISGLRVARDNPLFGAGPNELISLIQDNPRYNITPYGDTSSYPHDLWIFSLAVGGIPYALAVIWLTLVYLRSLSRIRSARSAERPYLQAGLVAVFPVFAINNIFSHPEVMLPVMLVTALLLTPNETDRESENAYLPVSRDGVPRVDHTAIATAS